MFEREKPKEEAKTGNKQTSRIDQKTISNYLEASTQDFFWLQIYIVEGLPDRK